MIFAMALYMLNKQKTPHLTETSQQAISIKTSNKQNNLSNNTSSDKKSSGDETQLSNRNSEENITSKKEANRIKNTPTPPAQPKKNQTSDTAPQNHTKSPAVANQSKKESTLSENTNKADFNLNDYIPIKRTIVHCTAYSDTYATNIMHTKKLRYHLVEFITMGKKEENMKLDIFTTECQKWIKTLGGDWEDNTQGGGEDSTLDENDCNHLKLSCSRW